MFQFYTQPVAESHLTHRRNDPMRVQRIGRNNSACLHILEKFSIQVHGLDKIRKVICIPVDLQKNQLTARFLKLRRDDMLMAGNIHRERHQRGRYIDLIKRPGHTVLAADGRQSEPKLCAVGAQKRRKRLTPAMWILCHPAEIFLERKADPAVIPAGCHDLRHRFQNGIDRSVIGRPAGQVWIKPITHHGDRIGRSLQHRQFCHHGLSLRQLISAAVGHEHASGSDGTVKHLHQSLLRTYVQISQHGKPCLPDIAHFFSLKILLFLRRHIHGHRGLLMSTVGVQKRAGEIHDLLPSPSQNQPRRLCHLCHTDRLQILLGRIFHKFIHMLRIYHHCHALLRFRDGDLRPVQTRIFFWHLVQIHQKPVRQLTDGYRYASCTEVITLFNQTGHLRTAEQSLNLPLCRRISLLDLRAAGLNGSLCMHLGGTGGSAAAVPSGTSAQQNDDIPRIGSLPDHILPGRRSHDRTDLHTLCHIVRMIDLLHISGGKSDLISIGAVPAGCAPHQLLLGKLAFQRL